MPAALVILVDEHDRQIGVEDKLAAHRDGLLHRAVSVLAFDHEGRLILQRRAAGKYHTGGLWSNSACTHPREDESLEDAARRCVETELGTVPTELRYAFPMVYRAEVGPGLVEHEYDHVFTCRVLEPLAPDPEEVAEVRAVMFGAVRREVRDTPEVFTPWFRLIAERLEG